LRFRSQEMSTEGTTNNTPKVGTLSFEEFTVALTELFDAGWKFEMSTPIRLVQRSQAPPDVDALENIRTKYPSLPEEVGALCRSTLTGEPPPKAIFGDDDNATARKQGLVERTILDKDSRERFFLQECGKVPMYSLLDWEVVVKVTERGLLKSPRFPYAILSLHTIYQSHGDSRHASREFAIGLQGVGLLIEELEAVRLSLQTASCDRSVLQESTVTDNASNSSEN